MISVEAYRAAIGRFSRKASYISCYSASKERKWIDIVFFIFLSFLQVLLYGLVVTTLIAYFSYIMLFLMLSIIYGYSYFIVKTSSDMLCTTIQRITKRNELMCKPAPPIGVKGHTLIPCNYLDTYVFDGRCSCLDTIFVLDGGAGQTKENNRINNRKLVKSFSKALYNLLCCSCNMIIFSSFNCADKKKTPGVYLCLHFGRKFL